MAAAPKEITDVPELAQHIGYKDWFSDQIALGYMSSFPARMKTVSGKGDMDYVAAEMDGALTVYAVLAYVLYPSSQQFRKAIDSSKEHAKNFKAVKEYLSKNGGEEMASRFMELARKTANE